MDLIIVGTVLVSVSIICATWYAVTIRAQKLKEAQTKRRERDAHNERIMSNNSLSLYQYEEQRRIDAETREGILRDQLKRSRKENERLLKLISYYEVECGLHREAI